MGTDLDRAQVGELKRRIEDLEQANRSMRLLVEMLSYLQAAEDLETTLRVMLTCVTSGYTLGFNRAFLFLYDNGRLNGVMAVGPGNPTEAGEIWHELETNTSAFEDVVASCRMGGSRGDRELTEIVRKITVDVEKTSSILARSLKECRCFVMEDTSSLSPDDVIHQLEPKGFACVPMVSGSKPIGLILADNSITCRVPTKEQVDLLKMLAWQAGQIVEKARYQEDIKRRLQELSTLNEVSKGILATTDLEADLTLIARISAQALNARGAVVRLVEDGNLVTKAIFSRTLGDVTADGDEGGQMIAEKVASEGCPVLINDLEHSDLESGCRQNLMCVPLSKTGKVIGTLTVFDKIGSESLGESGFTREDFRFLSVLAGQAAIAIENAKLFDRLKQKEEHIKELHRHLLHSERLAALGEVSSQVAHEIRNPLTAIGGFARSIRRKMGDDDPDARALDVIISETARLERILNEQLSFAKLSPPDLKLDDVNTVIRETLDLLGEAIASRQANLEVELADDLPQAYIDADKMKQVFINLMQNALDSIDEGGTIRVRTNRLDRTIEIRFANDGPPIPKQILDKLFVPFATGKAGGSGLGLAIAYEIVYEHGGVIDVRSEEGLGTIFLITLPLVIEGDRRRGPIDRRSPIRDRRRGRIP